MHISLVPIVFVVSAAVVVTSAAVSPVLALAAAMFAEHVALGAYVGVLRLLGSGGWRGREDHDDLLAHRKCRMGAVRRPSSGRAISPSLTERSDSSTSEPKSSPSPGPGPGVTTCTTPLRTVTHAQPGVTIVKAMHMSRPGLEECVESCFRLSYPNLEVLLCLESPRPDLLNMVERVRTRHPHVDSRVIIGRDHRYPRCPPMATRSQGWEQAKHDLVWFVDDVVVVSDAPLRSMVHLLSGSDLMVAASQPPACIPSRMLRYTAGTGTGSGTFGIPLMQQYLASVYCHTAFTAMSTWSVVQQLALPEEFRLTEEGLARVRQARATGSRADTDDWSVYGIVFGGSFVLKKSLIKTTQLFETMQRDQVVAEDVYLTLQLQLQGFTIGVCPHPYAWHRPGLTALDAAQRVVRWYRLGFGFNYINFVNACFWVTTCAPFTAWLWSRGLGGTLGVSPMNTAVVFLAYRFIADMLMLTWTTTCISLPGYWQRPPRPAVHMMAVARDTAAAVAAWVVVQTCTIVCFSYAALWPQTFNPAVDPAGRSIAPPTIKITASGGEGRVHNTFRILGLCSGLVVVTAIVMGIALQSVLGQASGVEAALV